jgi:hypothetical protein
MLRRTTADNNIIDYASRAGDDHLEDIKEGAEKADITVSGNGD